MNLFTFQGLFFLFDLIPLMSFLCPIKNKIELLWRCFILFYLSNNLSLSPIGISTKKNVAINASKDFSGSHLWGNSSIPFGGTLPSRGAHGDDPGQLTLQLHSLTAD